MTSFDINWQEKSYLKVKRHIIISEITCNWETDYPSLLLIVLVIYNVTGINKNSQHNNRLCVSAVEFLICVLPKHSNLWVWCQHSIVKKLLPLGTYLLNVLHKGAVYCQGEHPQLPSVRWSNKLSELILLLSSDVSLIIRTLFNQVQFHKVESWWQKMCSDHIYFVHLVYEHGFLCVEATEQEAGLHFSVAYAAVQSRDY